MPKRPGKSAAQQRAAKGRQRTRAEHDAQVLSMSGKACACPCHRGASRTHPGEPCICRRARRSRQRINYVQSPGGSVGNKRHEGILTYATWSDTDSTVRVRVYDETTNGVPVVVFSELDGNDGLSITNSVEFAIAALQQKFVFHIAPDYYEHYPRSSSEAASFDQIVSVSPAPQWRHANVEQVAARCGIDIDELLT